MKTVDYSGRAFGRLTVISMVRIENAKRGVYYCRCLCQCGNQKDILPHSLMTGRSRSCGCFLSESTAQRGTTHGKSGSAEYRIWWAMKKRCYYGRNKDYHNYGGRGIKICDQWLGANGFISFFSDMGQRPSAKHTIDRLNNSGDYTPDNCEWATKARQARNTRRNITLEHDGMTMILQDWANHLGLHRTTIERRLAKGLSIDKVLAT